MENLKIITMQDILDLKPCTDPLKYASMDWKGTALDILKNDKVLPEHRMWVVLKSDFISLKSKRMFAVRISGKALDYINPVKVLELKDIGLFHIASLYYLLQYHLDDNNFLAYNVSISCRTYVSLKDQVDCLIQVLGE